jgi:hypothetical protein
VGFGLAPDIYHGQDLMQESVDDESLGARGVVEVRRWFVVVVETPVVVLIQACVERGHLLQRLEYAAEADVDLGPVFDVSVVEGFGGSEDPWGALDNSYRVCTVI